MRVGVVRSDISKVYLNDVENTSQRCFSSEPAGQSRYFHKPSDAELVAIETKYGVTQLLLPVIALKAAIYPTPVTIDVSAATIQALPGIAALAPAQKAAITTEIQDLVAPKLVETGPALLSFVYGNLSKLRSASFQPGGLRIGLPAGVGVAILQNDCVTPFVI